jgi:hypothetical protein
MAIATSQQRSIFENLKTQGEFFIHKLELFTFVTQSLYKATLI